MKTTPKLKKSWISKLSASDADTTIIAGREITIQQVPHMKAEVKAAASILHKLKAKRAPRVSEISSSTVVKTIEI